MLNIVLAMCLITVNIDTNTSETIVTQVNVINSDREMWIVDAYRALSEGNYDMDLNVGTRDVDSNDCLIISGDK